MVVALVKITRQENNIEYLNCVIAGIWAFSACRGPPSDCNNYTATSWGRVKGSMLADIQYCQCPAPAELLYPETTSSEAEQ